MKDPYREAAPAPEEDLKPFPRYRILRVPYLDGGCQHRYLLQEYQRYFWFWRRWNTIDTALSLETSLYDYDRLMLKQEPEKVVWMEGDPRKSPEPVRPQRIDLDDDDDDDDDEDY